ncbi:MAG: class I SAM-dependent methyltransferase [Thermoanaerobaculia bacterium]
MRAVPDILKQADQDFESRRLLLQQAEALERAAAADRVQYMKGVGVNTTPILDVGCGNGYSVMEWRAKGLAIGVDLSLYRLSRWVAEHKSSRPFVVADARALPFRDSQFAYTVSSGMLEHVGVSEVASPYRVTALPTQRSSRAQVVSELSRVTRPGGTVILDFPNGLFPIDFWHGDSLGAFRIHPVPDVLNPTLWEIRSYVRHGKVTLLPLRNRLRFRQISRRWWGRLLAGPVQLFLRGLDVLPRSLVQPLLGLFYPFLVIRFQRDAIPP